MHKQIIFVFLLAISGTIFATETETMTTEQTTFEQQTVNFNFVENSASEIKITILQKIKSGLNNYFIRDGILETALNLTNKIVALGGLAFVFSLYKNPEKTIDYFSLQSATAEQKQRIFDSLYSFNVLGMLTVLTGQSLLILCNHHPSDKPKQISPNKITPIRQY